MNNFDYELLSLHDTLDALLHARLRVSGNSMRPFLRGRDHEFDALRDSKIRLRDVLLVHKVA